MGATKHLTFFSIVLFLWACNIALFTPSTQKAFCKRYYNKSDYSVDARCRILLTDDQKENAKAAILNVNRKTSCMQDQHNESDVIMADPDEEDAFEKYVANLQKQ